MLTTPLFVTVALTQAATRDGYELGPHMVSQLATGDGGWLQIVNFLVAGTLFLLAAAGVRRVAPQQKWMSRLIGFFGAGVIAAGVFVADPAAGYPVGVPTGFSWHGVLHGAAAAVSGLALAAAGVIQARRWYGEGQRERAAAAALASLAFVVLPFTGSDQSGLMFALASVIGWGILGDHRTVADRPGGMARTVSPQPVHA